MAATKKISNKARLAGLTVGVLALLPATTSAAPPLERELITSQGRGEVRVRPDSLRVEIGAEAQAKTLEQAQREVNQRIQSVLQAVNKLQIPGLSLETQTIELSPILDTRDPSTRGEVPKIVGYRAVNTIAVTVAGAPPDALGTLASRLVDVGTRVGATTVGSISFFVKDAREARDRALAAAVRDAQRSARLMARAAGVRLGKLHSIDGSPVFQGGLAKRGFAALTEATPVVTGETVISSSVSVRFHFLDR